MKTIIIFSAFEQLCSIIYAAFTFFFSLIFIVISIANFGELRYVWQALLCYGLLTCYSALMVSILTTDNRVRVRVNKKKKLIKKLNYEY